jgi:MFS family permease
MEIFKNTQFLKLWGNQVLLQIAFNMCNFTALLMLDHITQSRFALAQFYAAMTLPAFVVGFFAGAIVDMSNRKILMLITDAALCILFFGYALFSGNYWAILTIAFFAASVSQFFTPAEAATMPLIVKGKQLHQANSVFLFTGLGSVMIGYALAGPVIQYFGGLENNGPQATFIFASILTGIGFLLRLTLHTIDNERADIEGQKLFAKTIALTKEVLHVTRTDYKISIPILMLTLMEFNIGLLAILFIDYVKQYLSVPTTSTSYFLVLPLIAGLGFGVAILGLMLKWFHRGTSIFIGAISFGIILLILGLSGKFFANSESGTFILRLITVTSAGLIGTAAVFIAVHSRTILQESTPEKMLGRVFSLVTISASAVTPIPVLLVAFLTETVDVTTVFIVFGIFLTLVSLLIKPLLTHHVK